MMLSLHVIAWASSISWGYLTAILYAAPSTMTIVYFLKSGLKADRRIRLFTLSIPLIAFSAFYLGHQFYYSLEGAMRRDTLTVDMGDISPALGHIRATPEQHHLYSELRKHIDRFPGCAFVVLPNMPLAHVLNNSSNPIGIDWPLNAEVGRGLQVVKDRLNDAVDFAIVRKKSSPSPEGGGKFGSDVTLHVMATWKGAELSDKFTIYFNPDRSCPGISHF